MALLLVAAGMAGCIGSSDQPPGSTGPTEADRDAAMESDQANASEGWGGQAREETPARYVEETRELTWDGYMPGFVYTCTPGPCMGAEPPLGGGEADNVHELGTDPMPVSAEFTLTWDDPHNDVKEMLFGIVTDGCRDGCQELIWKEGTSGVTIAVGDVNLSEDQGFAVTVHHTYQYYPVDRTWWTGGPPVDFTVTGQYTVRVPAGGS